MKRLIVFLFFIFLIFPFEGSAQELVFEKDDSPKNLIAINLMGVSPAVGLSYERFLKSKLSLELGVGGNFWHRFESSWSTGLGFKWYPFYKEDRAVSIYIGLSSVFYQYTAQQKCFIHYLPIGLTIYNQYGLHIGINVGPTYLNRLAKTKFQNDSFFKEDFRWYGGLKVGLRF